MKRPSKSTFDVLLSLLAERLAVKMSKSAGTLIPRLLRFECAAAYLCCTNETLQQMIDLGKLPIVRVDRQVFLDRADLDQWIADHKTGWV